MNVLEAIKQRREITSFEQKELPDDIVQKIIESAYLSPSGNNLPSKEFIIVRTRETLDYLAQTTPYMPWLREAMTAVVVLGRPNISKYWLQDTSIACGFIWLNAVDIGLGAAFGAVYHSEDDIESERRESYVRSKLDIPEDRRVVAIIGMGYPKKLPAPKKLLPIEETIYYEKFSE